MDDSWSQGPAAIQTTIAWPDETVGPWEVALAWEVLDGRWEVVGLEVHPHISAQHRPLRAVDLRGLQLREIAERSRRQLLVLAASLTHDPGPEWLRMSAEELDRAEYLPPGEEREEAFVNAEMLRDAAKVSTDRVSEFKRVSSPSTERGRPRLLGPQHYRRVAEVYARAYTSGSYPTRAVAESFHVSRSAAAKWIAHCRELGLLGKTAKRKAGGVPEKSE